MATPPWKIRRFAPVVTEPERIFFHKGLKNAGVPFKTQQLLRGASGRRYRVDGLVTPNIVVEIDGESHDHWKQKLKDEARDKDLREVGYLVIRFKNWEVRKQLGKCVAAVKRLQPANFRDEKFA